MDWMQIEQQYTSGVYGKRNLTIVRGQGAHLWDADGREYIDCTAGIGVASIGHANPTVAAAVAEQAQTLITCAEMFYNDRRAELLERLVNILPDDLNRIYLCNSGTEAIEAAIKFARLSTARTDVVAMMRGFHGRTMGALSATHKKHYRQPFEPLVPGFSHVPFGNIGKLEAAITDQTAAVVLEVVQGEGGVRLAEADYFQAVRQLCDERGALLIIDEVQTGFGRTGQWFACQHYDLTPDLLAMGKAIAGGVPMGAVAIGPRIEGLTTGLHGSTFGGNPLACAASLASLQVYEEQDLVARSAELGAYFLERLQEINSPLIREVRGLGLMIGIEMKGRVHSVVEALTERGILVLTAGTTVLRLLPPLVIEREDIDTVVDTLRDVLSEMGS